MLFKFNKVKLLCFLLFSSLLVTSCGGFKRSDVKDNPVNDADKRAKNIQEGRGVGALFGGTKNRGGSFDFATSNEMWRASIETLDFVSLTNASYSGGIIITDWFKGNSSENRELKITIQFLANEIRADALSIAVHEKICDAINSQSCTITKVNSAISGDLKLAILKKAALIKNDSLKKKKKKKKKS